MNPLKECLTLNEAAFIWQITSDSLRHKCNRDSESWGKEISKHSWNEKFTKDEIVKTETPRGEWKILRSAMIRLYGEPPKQ